MSSGDAPVEPKPDLRLLPALAGTWAAAWWATAAGAAAAAVAAGVVLGTGVFVAVGTVRQTCRRGSTSTAAGWATRRPRGTPYARRHGDARRFPTVAPAAVLTLAAVGVVLAATAAQCAARYRSPLTGWVTERAVVEATGRAVGDARPVAGGPVGGPERFTVRVRLERATGRGRAAEVAAPVLVLGGPGWRSVTAGELVTVLGRLRPAEPGDDVVALLSAQGAPRAVVPGAWPWQAADRLRAGLREASRGLPADAGGLLPSLVVGDTSTLPERLRTDLQVAGLTHITAVSGANVAIAAGAALWLATTLGAGRRIRVGLAAAVLVGFVVVARPQPSVLRAAAMGGLALLGLSRARRSPGVPVLAGAAVVLLAVDPWLARSAGFALSCLATGGLLLLAPPWTRSLGHLLPVPLAAGLAVPAAAQAACGPVLVLLQPSVSVVSVPANLLAEPAVAPATVLGVLAALTAPVWPGGAALLARLGGVATGWIAVVAHRSASVPFAAVPWPSGLGGALALAALTLVIILATTRSRRRTGPQRGAAEKAGRGALRALAGAVAVVLALAAGWWAGPRVGWWPGRVWPPAGWALVQCDVGQGAALVVRSGVDRAVLVDTGPDPLLIDTCLRRLGVRRLDVILLTHYHADHVGGLQGAIAGRDVGQVLVSPLAEPVEAVAAVRDRLAAIHVTARTGWAGMSGETGSGGPAASAWSARWRLLAPADPPAGSNGVPDGEDGSVFNESSLAYVIDIRAPAGAMRLVGMGDLETTGQQRLLGLIDGGSPLGSPADVVEVAHHGSARQVPELYAALAARIVLIGVGAANEFGHPAPSALAMLRREGPAAFRTDSCGSIAVVTGPRGELSVVSARGPPG